MAPTFVADRDADADAAAAAFDALAEAACDRLAAARRAFWKRDTGRLSAEAARTSKRVDSSSSGMVYGQAQDGTSGAGRPVRREPVRRRARATCVAADSRAVHSAAATRLDRATADAPAFGLPRVGSDFRAGPGVRLLARRVRDGSQHLKPVTDAFGALVKAQSEKQEQGTRWL